MSTAQVEPPKSAPAGYPALAVGVVVLTAAAVTAIFVPLEIGLPVAAAAFGIALIGCPALFVALRQRARAKANALALQQLQEHIAATEEHAARQLADAEHRAASFEWDAQENSRRGSAALAAFAGAAGRIQAMTTSMLAELREMEHRHADPRVLTDLLHLDHRTAQAGRLADSIAVLSGARTGRRWAKPIAMESILRGAMGRVAGYQRVRLRAVADVGVVGHAAEGVMHTLAELLDNACNFSPPTTEVHVYAAEVPAGVVITIEDSGLVMSDSALRRAQSAVSGDESTDLASLSGTRLGLAVVGHLARKHDLTVSFRPSAIGGTAVVVVVPRDLTARAEPRSRPMQVIAPTPRGLIPNTMPNHLATQVPGQPQASTLNAPMSEQLTDSAPVNETPTRDSQRTTVPDHPVVQVPETVSRPATFADYVQDQPVPRAAPKTPGGLPKRRRGVTLAQVHPDGLTGQAPAPFPPRQAGPATSPGSLGAFQRSAPTRPPTAARDEPGAPFDPLEDHR
ncbi:ATP-binding protein [Nocardia camponoti]|uniref:histidine kinase n=1 Tax=Nocardia camponoti TaxID=1616106 RepID=A0A917QCU1_9NOCA|nr:ATP-binding protein [Nocardia camponoti]GGK44529.1 histidine kinase [Nocardia camponoti]